jgi:hypothetical protein
MTTAGDSPSGPDGRSAPACGGYGHGDREATSGIRLFALPRLHAPHPRGPWFFQRRFSRSLVVAATLVTAVLGVGVRLTHVQGVAVTRSRLLAWVGVLLLCAPFLSAGCSPAGQLIRACKDTVGSPVASSDGSFLAVATTRACPLTHRRLTVDLSTRGLWPVNSRTVFSVEGPYLARLEWSGPRTISIVVHPMVLDDTNGGDFRESSRSVTSWRGAAIRVTYIPLKQDQPGSPR